MTHVEPHVFLIGETQIDHQGLQDYFSYIKVQWAPEPNISAGEGLTEGLATTLGISFNHRALRHIILMRTSRHAETELRLIFDKVALIAIKRWPNVFQDLQRIEVDGIGEWTIAVSQAADKKESS